MIQHLKWRLPCVSGCLLGWCEVKLSLKNLNPQAVSGSLIIPKQLFCKFLAIGCANFYEIVLKESAYSQCKSAVKITKSQKYSKKYLTGEKLKAAKHKRAKGEGYILLFHISQFLAIRK